ncbi:MFS transporter, partial [Deinococcus pimensis]|uniref:MFS transporter n=1 Tax=Deinococcus pimensis TaxID=309888 RepID=UPI0012F80BD6
MRSIQGIALLDVQDGGRVRRHSSERIKMRLPAVLPTDLPRPALTLLAGDALFWLAEGLVFPYLLVYLQRRLHLELSVAGLVAGWVGLSGLVGVTLAGVLIDRRGARVAVTFGLLGAALGAAAFALSSNAPQALL